jgi:hypothetical protein
MNSASFRRAEALENLESYARVIVIHLALTEWFPGHDAQKHWQAELNAFVKTLRRYDNAKKRAHNFTIDLIKETLEDEIIDNSSRDAVLIAVEGHGVMAPDRPDFNAVANAIEAFAQRILAYQA